MASVPTSKAQPRPIGPPAQRPASSSERWAELDGYRGLLAVAIVIFHCNQQSRLGGNTYVYQGTAIGDLLANLEAAVAAFLALSGFLLFLPFARAALAGQPSPSLKRFLTRRFARVAAPYWIALILVWSARFGGGGDQILSLVEHLSFTQVFDANHIFWDIGPAWFLADNMIFYFVVAAAGWACCVLCRRLYRPLARLAVLTLAALSLATISVAYKWWAANLAHIPRTDFPVYFGPLAKLDLFALGMLLAVVTALLRGRRPLVPGLRIAVMTVGVALTAWTFGQRNVNDFTSLYFHTLCGIGFTLILAGMVLSPPGGLLKRVLTLRPLVLLGVVSYSLFLWHEPVLIEVTATHHLLTFTDPATFGSSVLILLGLAMVAAVVAYWLIEIPTKKVQLALAAKTESKPDVPASIAELRSLSWDAFESLLVGACERRGWRVVGGGMTKGSPLQLRQRKERRTLVCELWWRRSLDRSEMAGLIAKLAIERRSEIGIITGGELSQSAEELAEAAGLEVIAGPDLVALLGPGRETHPWLDLTLLPLAVDQVLDRLDAYQPGAQRPTPHSRPLRLQAARPRRPRRPRPAPAEPGSTPGAAPPR